MSDMIYIQDDFGNHIPLLDGHGNLTVQVLMLYSEDKLTEVDRKTVSDFAATDEMAMDALEGFALTSNPSKTRHHLGQLNNDIQKKTGAATAAVMPRQESDFDYRKLAAAIAVLIVIGGATFFGAKYFGKDKLADNAKVKTIKLEQEAPDRKTVRASKVEELESVEEVAEVAEKEAIVVDLKAKVGEPKGTVVNSDSRSTEAEPKQKELPKTEVKPADNTTDEQFAKAKDKKSDDDNGIATTSFAAANQVMEEITLADSEATPAKLAKKTENVKREENNEADDLAENQRLQQVAEATTAKADREAERLDRKVDEQAARSSARQKQSEMAYEMATLAEEKADQSKVAKYPGGDIAMYKFIARKKIYTDAMRALNLNGAVTVSFDIEPDGRVTNVMVKAGENGLMNEDALRVVRSMPKWIPAHDASGTTIHSSKSVVVKYGQ